MAQTPPVRFARTDDGVVLPFRVVGDGPRAMVIAHSLGTTALDAWPLYGPLVDAGFRIATYDQRGFGRATPLTDPGAYALDRFGSDLLAVCDAAGFRTAWFCGASMGAAVALNAMRRAPDRADGLALLAPAFEVAPHPEMAQFPPLGRAFEGGMAAGCAAWEAHFRARGVPEDVLATQLEHLHAHDPASLAVALQAIPGWTIAAEVAALRDYDRPVVVMSWEGDPLHAMATGDMLAAAAPCGRLRPIGHADFEAGGPLMLFQILADLVEDPCASLV